MNFISIGFWAAFCAFFLIYIFVRKWSRVAMLLWVIAFDLFFFWQANGWLMLLLPATAAANYFLTELMRRPAGAEGWRCGGRSGNWFFGKLVRKIISARTLGGCDRRQDLGERALVRAQGFDGPLRLPQFRGRDELHRRSDLQRAADRPDPVFDLPK